MERMTVGQKFNEMVGITGRHRTAAMLVIADALYSISDRIPETDELSATGWEIAEAIKAVALEIREKSNL